MKVVKILTLIGTGFNQNLGANLQAFALKKIIEKFDYKAEFINFAPWIKASSIKIKIQKAVKLLMKRDKKTFIEKVKWEIQSYITKVEYYITKEAQMMKFRRVEEFKRKYLQLPNIVYHSKNELETLPPSDYIVVGSDVVWFPSKDLIDIFLLSFVKNSRKISYAASVATKIPDELKEIYKKYLDDFTFISVREKKSWEEIAPLTNIKVDIVLDPTLLLKAEEWRKFSKKPDEAPNEEYILVYDLYRSNEILPSVNKFARERGVKFICYQPYTFFKKLRYQTLCGSYYHYDPLEFLWLIDNSKYVITSSFHGTALSVVFKKSFVAINPVGMGGLKDDISSRLIDFLSMLNLEDRYVNNISKTSLEQLLDKPINWNEVDEILLDKRKKSISFLKKALEIPE